MKTGIEYIIVAEPFHADAATHEELERKVNEKLSAGYEPYSPPFNTLLDNDHVIAGPGRYLERIGAWLDCDLPALITRTAKVARGND